MKIEIVSSNKIPEDYSRIGNIDKKNDKFGISLGKYETKCNPLKERIKIFSYGMFKTVCSLGLLYYYDKNLREDIKSSLKGKKIIHLYSKNPNVAFQYYKKAADQGDASAQNNIGWCYLNGIGVQKNPEKAFEYYEKSADQGYAPTQEKV